MNNVDTSAVIANPASDMPALREALEDMCRAVEYSAGCDEGVTPDAASSEIMSFAGSWLACSYDKATALLSTSLAPRSGSVGEPPINEPLGLPASGASADYLDGWYGGQDYLLHNQRAVLAQASQPPTAPETSEICTGCGTTKSLTAIKAATPSAFSCCPERKMVPIAQMWREWQAWLSLPAVDGFPDLSAENAHKSAVDAGRREAAQIADDLAQKLKEDRSFLLYRGARDAVTAIRARIGKPLAGEV